MVSYHRIQWECQCLVVSKGNKGLDFATKVHSEKEKEEEADNL